MKNFSPEISIKHRLTFKELDEIDKTYGEWKKTSFFINTYHSIKHAQ